VSTLDTPETQAITDTAGPVEEERSPGGRVRGLAARLRPSVDVLRIAGVWFAWLVVVCAFQIVVQARLQPARPDVVLSWTQYATTDVNLDCRAHLNDPAYNEHVSYDSEYYMSIALNGYNDPLTQAYYPGQVPGQNSGIPVCQPAPRWVSLNYAFMPGYPTAMGGVIAVENVVPGLSSQTGDAKAALAGIIVSALGGLLAMLALARLMGALARRKDSDSDDAETAAARGRWGGAGGLRAAFYLLAFPTGFYLAQIYTEGLFIGLAFMACAMAVEKKVVLAAVFAALAAIVRPTGLVLALPLAWMAGVTWFETLRDNRAALRDRLVAVRLVAAAIAPLVPIAVFLVWKNSILGQNWQLVEDNFFHRTFDVNYSIDMWGKVVDSFVNGVDKTGGIFAQGALPSSSTVYIGLDLLAVVVAVAASVWLFRKMPGVALFGLGILALSFFSSSAQGMDRYVLAVPAIFLMLASFGRRITFDRVWVLASTLLMGMLVMLYTFGFWVS
jgi:hypothetical protein